MRHADNQTGRWTTERPAESGFYWYREEHREPEVVRWDVEMEWLELTGNDVPWEGDWIEGEFWSERVVGPGDGEGTAGMPSVLGGAPGRDLEGDQL